MKGHFLAEMDRILGHAGSVRRDLLKGAAGSMVIKLSSTMLGLVLSVILARQLGAQMYGIYAFALSLVNVLVAPIQTALHNLVVRDIAKFEQNADWGALRGLWQRANQSVVGAVAALSIIGTVVVAFSVPDTVRGAEPYRSATLTWGFAVVALIALTEVRGATLCGLNHTVQGQLPDRLIRPLAFSVLLIGAYLSGMALDPSLAMILHATAAGLALFTSVGLLHRAMPAQARDANAQYRDKEWFASAAPLALLGGLQIFTQQTGVLALGLVATDVDAGNYRVAMQGATLVSFTLMAMNLVIAPQVSRSVHGGDVQKLRQVLAWTTRAVFLAALPVGGTLILFGEPVLAWVFGEEYRPANVPMGILCVGQLVNAATGPLSVLYNMSGNERPLTRAVALFAVINVAATFGLANLLGMVGAAVAAAFSMGMLNVWLWYRAKRHVGVRPNLLGYWH